MKFSACAVILSFVLTRLPLATVDFSYVGRLIARSENYRVCNRVTAQVPRIGDRKWIGKEMQ